MPVLLVLGGVRMVGPDGTTHEVPGSRRRAVVAHLVAAAHPVSADTLLAAHFDEPRSGRKAVQVLVAELRAWTREHGLDDGVVTTVGRGYSIGVPSDLERLRQLVEQARKQHDQGQPEEALRLASSAQELVRGPAFAPVAPSSSIVPLADEVDREVAALDELVANLRREVVVRSRPDDEPPNGRGAVGVLPFVGRHREVARARALTASVLSGAATGAWLQVLGAQGSGRRQLVDHVLARVHTADVLTVACQQEHPGIELTDVVGVAVDEATPTDPAWRSAERADAIARQLATRGRRRPQVLVVTDAQWVGPALGSQLQAVMRHPGARALLVTTSTPGDETEDLLRLRRRLGPVVRRVDVRLAPLGPDAVRAAARAALEDMADRVDLDAALDWVVENAGGSPLHAGELVRAVREEGSVPTALPTALTGLLQARLERRSLPARALVGALTVLGDGAALDRLVAVATATEADLVPEQMDRALHELVEHDLVEVQADGVHLRPSAVAPAVRATLGPAGITRRHLAAADDLSRRRAVGLEVDAAEEARHRLAALPSGSIDATLDALLQAADASRGPTNPRQRLSDVRQALSRLVGLVGDDDHRLLALRVVHGEALSDVGSTGEARSVLLAAGADALGAAADGVTIRAGVALGRLFATVGHDPEALDLLRAALDLATDPADRTVLLGALALSGFLDFDPDSEAMADEALMEARRAGDARSIANGLNAHHLATAGFDIETWVSSAEACVTAAHRARDARIQVVAHLTRAKELLIAGRLGQAEADLDVTAGLVDRLGDARLRWLHATWMPVVHMVRGEMDAAAATIDAAAGLLHEDPDAAFIEAVQRAVLDGSRGRGRDVAQLSLIFTESHPRAAAFRGTVAFARLIDGEVDEAVRELATLVGDDLGGPPYSRFWLVGLAAASRTLMSLVDLGVLDVDDTIGGRRVRDVAADIADRTAPMAGQQLVLRLVRAGGFAFGPLDLARAEALEVAGRADEAASARRAAGRWTAANGATFWDDYRPVQPT